MIREIRLRIAVRRGPLPRHLGVVVDGNRRWARSRGVDVAAGHRAGARHVEDLLRWCEGLGVRHVTVYALPMETVAHRGAEELALIQQVLGSVLADTVLARGGRWQLHLAGDLSLLPDATRSALEAAAAATDGGASHVTFAVGYDGRVDLARAVAAAVHQMPAGGRLADTDITRWLSGGPVKDIDLVVRTGGGTRMPGVFPWQGADAYVHRSQATWPAFSRGDLLAALAGYARSRRRSA